VARLFAFIYFSYSDIFNLCPNFRNTTRIWNKTFVYFYTKCNCTCQLCGLTPQLAWLMRNILL